MTLPPVKSDGDSLLQPRTEELGAALNLLRSIMGAPEQQQLLNPNARPVNSMVYTHGVTLWMLILQRLGGGKTLNEVVSQIISHDRDLLPDNKRVRENTLSGNSARPGEKTLAAGNALGILQPSVQLPRPNQ